MADIINDALVDMLFGGSKSVATEVSGASPLTLADGKAKALNGLTLYGACTQDGTPTPDSPVDVVPVGDSGEISTELMGVNLLNITDATSKHFDISIDNNVITLDRKNVSQIYNNIAYSVVIPRSGYYVLSATFGGNWISGNNAVQIDSGASALMRIAINVTKDTVYMEAGEYYLRIYAGYVEVGQATLTDLRLAYIGDSYTGTPPDWEPYHEPQTLAISTSGGLCGIPVASGGNYTDASGQQWLADYVDFASGTLTKNVSIFDLTSARIFKLDSRPSDERVVFDCGRDTTYVFSISNLMCNRFPTVSTGGNKGYSYILPRSDSSQFYISVQYGECGIESSMTDSEILTAFRTWASENRVYFYEPVSTTTTQLTDEEIAAYKALMTYDGTTIIASDANYMTVNYAQKGSGSGSSALAWFFKQEGNELL